jgi:hypothetical protein
MYLNKIYYSPMYETQFTIVHIHTDSAGDPILTGVDDAGMKILFRPCELVEIGSNYFTTRG